MIDFPVLRDHVALINFWFSVAGWGYGMFYGSAGEHLNKQLKTSECNHTNRNRTDFVDGMRHFKVQTVHFRFIVFADVTSSVNWSACGATGHKKKNKHMPVQHQQCRQHGIGDHTGWSQDVNRTTFEVSFPFRLFLNMLLRSLWIVISMEYTIGHGTKFKFRLAKPLDQNWLYYQQRRLWFVGTSLKLSSLPKVQWMYPCQVEPKSCVFLFSGMLALRRRFTTIAQHTSSEIVANSPSYLHFFSDFVPFCLTRFSLSLSLSLSVFISLFLFCLSVCLSLSLSPSPFCLPPWLPSLSVSPLLSLSLSLSFFLCLFLVHTQMCMFMWLWKRRKRPL